MPLPAAYRKLQLANLVDSVGDGMFAAAVPLLAVTVTRDPRLVSVISAATYLPWLTLSLPIGALVDRHDRVKLMWRSQTLQGLIVAAVTTLAELGQTDIAILAVLAFALGSCEVIFSNAAQSVLPELVRPDQLPQANGQQTAAQTAGQLFVGPPLGSLLFGLAVWLPFGIDAATFAISASLLATLPRAPDLATARQRLWESVVEGVRYLMSHRLLRTLALLLGINNFCGQFGTATLVLYATSTLHVTPRGFGVLLAAAAVGGILGGFGNAFTVSVLGESTALLTALTGMVFTYVGLGLAPNAVVLGALLAANGYLVSMWNIVTVAFRQTLVPRALLGRVNSIYRMIGWGLMPLGAIAGGFIAHSFGLRAPYVAASAIRLSALLLLLPALLPALRAVRRTATAPRP